MSQISRWLMGLMLVPWAVGRGDEGWLETADKVRVYYRVAGAGEAVVLIHGWMADHRMWDPRLAGEHSVWKLLTPRYRVVALDCRGHGRSDKPHTDDAYGSQMADDVVRLLDHLGIEQANMVGYSMGSLIAGKVVAEHASRVRRVIFGGGAPLCTDQTEAYTRRQAFVEKRERDSRLNGLSQLFFGKQDIEALAAVHRGFVKLQVDHVRLRQFQRPVLFLLGEQEWEGIRRAVEDAQRLWGHGEVVTLRRGNHFTTPVQPGFAQAILHFLQRSLEEPDQR
ncbi:MAG: hypothetical protein KatS3mg114_0768 [Planctomycetaceae bacterium]|nr:MAG: hypothetical protein KatS3mg114_0768 [Planctomycetaceae bacterium]